MEGSTNTFNNNINNTIKSITEMKESTAIYLIVGITLLIVLIVILYYIYYSRLRYKQCSTMNAIYGNLNGKIRSIDNSEQFNYTFKYLNSKLKCF